MGLFGNGLFNTGNNDDGSSRRIVRANDGRQIGTARSKRQAERMIADWNGDHDEGPTVVKTLFGVRLR